MGFSIAPGAVTDDGVPELFAAADDYALGLYPAENYHALDVTEFTRPEVLLLVARSDEGAALGMAALAPADGYAELKRMYVHDDARGLGLGRALLEAIEAAARERGFGVLRLETSDLQAAAVGLYERLGYARIDRFGPYVDDPTSLCMEKTL